MAANLTIDDETAALLRASAAREGKPEGELAAGILRRVLASAPTPSAKAFLVRPHAATFAPGVDTVKLNRLAGQTELEEV
jgi:hypothetical protein